MKKQTRLAGPWHWPKDIPEEKEPYNEEDIISTLTPWQSKLETYLKGKVNPREILWIVDAAGCTGKSAFVKYCAVRLEAETFGWVSAKNTLHCVAGLQDPNPRIFLFDLTRVKPEAFSSQDIYSAMEDIKNGKVRSCMYDCPKKFFSPPHVVVFANQQPILNTISGDRWNIKFLKPEDIIPPTMYHNERFEF